MKKLMLIAALLCSQILLAGEWIPSGSYVNSATEIEGIRKILRNFPEIMSDQEFTAEDIRSLQVSLISLSYEGSTSCAQNDSRLAYNHFSYFICLKGDQGACIDHFDAFKSDEDPCLNP